ncbi:MAG TPA: glycosyltransferase [Streptosporangiaceae bacterium]|nr:glycosyltransferase [Streptosporangiaceae bacterium]
MSPNDSHPQHLVTAVLVAHDGAAWLPRVLDSLLSQSTPVQRVVAVDTGSRDRSGAVLAARLGQAAVFGMDRETGYAAAVTGALRHKAASVSVPGPPGRTGSERAEWIWLLHDDCEPALTRSGNCCAAQPRLRRRRCSDPRQGTWPIVT